MESDSGSAINGIIFLIIFFMMYFLPGLIASQRKHSNRGPIWAINFFLGWTFLGWVAALVWAMTSDQKPVVNVHQVPPEPQPAPSTSSETTPPPDDRVECPECAELIKPNAKKCRYCGSTVGQQPAPTMKDPEAGKRAQFGPAPERPAEQTACPGCGYVRQGHEDAPAWQCPNCLKAYNKLQ